jgi:hypothetical protein
VVANPSVSGTLVLLYEKSHKETLPKISTKLIFWRAHLPRIIRSNRIPLAQNAMATAAATAAAGVPLTSFGKFANLPPEIRGMVWDIAASAGNENIIEVCFDCAPTLRRESPRKPWQIVWTYRCHERNPSHILRVSSEAREQYYRSHPNILQLNRQLPIHFNATQDTLFFDCQSFFNLWDYVRLHRVRLRVPHRNLRGFNLIQTIGHFNSQLPPAELLDTNSFMVLRLPQNNVFTALTRIRLLSPRGIHPGPRPTGWNPNIIPGQTLSWWLDAALLHLIFNSNGSQGMRITPTVAQQRRIDRALARVAGDVAAFMAAIPANGTPLTLPIALG